MYFVESVQKSGTTFVKGFLKDFYKDLRDVLIFHIYEAIMHLIELYMILMQGGIQWQQTECVRLRWFMWMFVSGVLNI